MHITSISSIEHVQLPIQMVLTTWFWLFLLPRLTLENPLPSVGPASFQIAKEGSVVRESAEGIVASTRATFHDKPEESLQQQKNFEGLRQRTSQASTGEPPTTTLKEPDIQTRKSEKSGLGRVRKKLREALEGFKSWYKRLLSYFTSKPNRSTTDYTKFQSENGKEKTTWWNRFSNWISKTLSSRREPGSIQKDNELARSWRDQKKPQEGGSPIANQQTVMQTPSGWHAAEKPNQRPSEPLPDKAQVAPLGASPPGSQVPPLPYSNYALNIPNKETTRTQQAASIHYDLKKHPTKPSNSQDDLNARRPLKQPTPEMARQRSQALASSFVDESPSQEERADALRRRTLQTLRSLNLPVNRDIPTTKLEYLPGFVQSNAIRGDGNCQFRAVSVLCYGTQDYHLDLRREAVAWLRSNPDTVKSFMAAEAADPQIAQTLAIQNGKPSSPPKRVPPQSPQNTKPEDPGRNPFMQSSLLKDAKLNPQIGQSPNPQISNAMAPPAERSIVEQYCQHMEQEGVFGDDYTLFALAEVTKLDIVCVSATDVGHSISAYTKKAPHVRHNWKGVYLRSQHYELLLRDPDFNKPIVKPAIPRHSTLVLNSEGRMPKTPTYRPAASLQVKPGHQDISTYKFKLQINPNIQTELVVPGVVASKDLIEKSNESQFFVWQLFTHHSNDEKLAHSCREEAYKFLTERPDIIQKVEKLPQFQADWAEKFPGDEYNQEIYLQMLRAGAISENIMTLSALAELKKMKIVVYEMNGDKAPSTIEIIPKVFEDDRWIGLIKRVEKRYNDNYQLLYKLKYDN